MIQYSKVSCQILLFLGLFTYPQLATAGSNPSDAEIAKKFYPTQCNIIKGQIDASSPLLRSDGTRSVTYPISGKPKQVMFAELVKGNLPSPTNLDLSFKLSVLQGAVQVSSTYSDTSRNILPRLSWQFSEEYPTVDVVLESKTPVSYEVMVVWTTPDATLSKAEIEKFAPSDPLSLADNATNQAQLMLDLLANPDRLKQFTENRDAVLENNPIYRIDIKSMCQKHSSLK